MELRRYHQQVQQLHYLPPQEECRCWKKGLPRSPHPNQRRRAIFNKSGASPGKPTPTARRRNQTTLETRAAQRAAELAEVVASARSEFDRQREQLQATQRVIESEFRELQQQVGEKGTGDKKYRGFLPLKELRPPKLANDTQWREWSDQFSEYVEASCSGMKDCLRAVTKFESRPDSNIIVTLSYSTWPSNT